MRLLPLLFKEFGYLIRNELVVSRVSAASRYMIQGST